jgi:hypothetical protein
MFHVGKYIDWRLIQTAPFEEDVELFVTDVDGSDIRERCGVNPQDRGCGAAKGALQ